MQERAVLFVDDDEIVLQDLERSLKDEAYDKHFAGSCAEALDILQQEEVHVMVVDMVMPRMDGLELIKIAKKEYPHIVTMVLSAYAQPADVMTVMFEQGIYKYIAKPWKFDGNLRTVIQSAVDHYDLLMEHEDVFAESRRCSDPKGVAECPPTP
ncbi:MAG: response regulator [Planctomycetota bacterium]